MRKLMLIAVGAAALMGCQAAASEDYLDDEDAAYEAAAATLENQADNLEVSADDSLDMAADTYQSYGGSTGLTSDRLRSELASQADALTREYDSSPYSSGLTFKGDDCLYDCSGHEAGYEWAEDKGISDPDDCGGKSQSFIEGCEAYAEEQQSEAEL